MHRDKNDAPVGAVVITRDFEKGALILWELGIRILLREGDAIFFSSRDITHSVENYSGQRYALALYLSNRIYSGTLAA